MKKSTKKTLMALAIVLLFGLSTIAYVATSFISPQTTDQQQLTGNLIEGPVDASVQQNYVQNGFTWVTFYYQDADKNFISFMDSLPSTLTTSSGQQQIILNKINSTYQGTAYVFVDSRAGTDQVANLTEQNIVDSLCPLLTITPLECGLQNIFPAVNNTTNSTY